MGKSKKSEDAITRADIDDVPGTTAAAGQLVTPLVNEVIGVIKKLRQPWDKLSEGQQQLLISSLGDRITAFANGVIEVLATAEHPSFEVKLESFGQKDHDLSAKLTATANPELVLAFSKATGTVVRVTMIDQSVKNDGSVDRVKPDPEAPALPLMEKPPAPDGPEGDTDLVEAGEAVAADRVEVAA